MAVDSDAHSPGAAMNLSHHRKIKTTEAQNQFGSIVDRVAIAKEPVILERRGRLLAAIIPMEEFRILERVIQQAEDEIDIRESERALAKDREFIPLEQILKESKRGRAQGHPQGKTRKGTAALSKRPSGTHISKTARIGARAKGRGKARGNGGVAADSRR
jgi:prevent-host-death family protein